MQRFLTPWTGYVLYEQPYDRQPTRRALLRAGMPYRLARVEADGPQRCAWCLEWASAYNLAEPLTRPLWRDGATHPDRYQTTGVAQCQDCTAWLRRYCERA